MLKALRLLTGVALLGALAGELLTRTNVGGWACAFVAILAFKGGVLYERSPPDRASEQHSEKP